MPKITGLRCEAEYESISIDGGVVEFHDGDFVLRKQRHVLINTSALLSSWVVLVLPLPKELGMYEMSVFGKRGDRYPTVPESGVALGSFYVGDDGRIYTDHTQAALGVTDLRNLKAYTDILAEAGTMMDCTADPGAVAAFLKKRVGELVSLQQ